MNKLLKLLLLVVLVLAGCSAPILNETTLKNDLEVKVENGFLLSSYEGMQFVDGQIGLLDLSVYNGSSEAITLDPSQIQISTEAVTTELITEFEPVTIKPSTASSIELVFGLPMELETLEVAFTENDKNLGKLDVDMTTLEIYAQEFTELDNGIAVSTSGVDYEFTDMTYMSFNQAMDRFGVYSDPINADYYYFAVNTKITNNSGRDIETDGQVAPKLIGGSDVYTPDFDFMSKFTSQEVLNLSGPIADGQTASGYLLYKLPLDKQVDTIEYMPFIDSELQSSEILEIKIGTTNQ